MAATGGVAPYTWSISSGSLPAGLSLNSSTGTISGTPTTAGLSSFTIQVADSEPSPQKATLPASIASSSGTLAITTTSLPAATDGAAYSQTLTTSGGVPPLTWSVGTSPALPAGLSLASSTGTISGTPTGVSATSPQFTVTDAAKNSASASLQFVVNPAPGTMPTGPYNFLFSGTSPKGSVAVAGTFSLSGSGSPYTVTGGEFDENTNSNTTSAASETPTINGASLNTPYTVDRTTGRVVTTIPNEPEPILYLIDSKRAFILGTMLGSNTSSSSGILQAQTGSSLTNASLSGSYLGGSLSLDNTGVLNEDGIITADGNGNITFTTNRSTSKGLVQYQSVTGTYRAVGSNGRIEVTLPDGLTRIIYIVSPTKIIYLTSDTGGYVGVFEQ